MIRRRVALAPAFMAAAMMVACKDEAPPVPGSLTVAAGDQQAAVVGSALPTPPAVLLKDTKGRPMNGVAVTFAVTGGGGSLGGLPSVKTGADGIAHAGTWTLGTSASANTITATVKGLAPLVFTANAHAGAPTTALPSVGDGQTATVGSSVGIRPAVVLKDNFGNGVPNVTVTFAATVGGGSVAGAEVVTDATGTATVGGWTLGTASGLNTLTATASNGTAYTFTAVATPGAPAQMAVFAGDGQSISIFSSVPVRPAVVVRDQFGNGVPGVVVIFSVTSGGGTVTGGVQTTGTTGIAVVGSWTLGASQGPNTLTAQSAGLNPINFSATAIEPLVYTMSVVAGDGQTAPAGWTTGTPPTVAIRDQFNGAAVGKTVTFTVISGDGNVTNATATTDNSGIAKPTWWRLGFNAGINTVTATAADVNNTVTFTATASAPIGSNGYSIGVAYVAPPTARQHQAVVNAVTRWQQAITGDLSDITPLNLTGNSCYPTFVNETIDDMLVIVDFSAIDGPGNILGSATWCLARQSNRLPVIGRLRLDAADLTNMENNGTIDDVVLHEIAHTLGLGTSWSLSGLLSFSGTDSVTFTGPLAGAAFLANGGSSFIGNPVPVENCKTSSGTPINGCGPGTRDGHWREAVLGRELMTGYISPSGIANPLSAITVESFADLGYSVDESAADVFIVGTKPIPGTEPTPIFLNEATPNWPKRFIDDR